jgi:DNA-binding beta-propeller fold protein YncE
MSTHRRTVTALFAGLAGIVGVALAASVAGAGPPERLTDVHGTIWVANRLAAESTIRAFDATTGDSLATVSMAPNSQPGDLAYAKGKLYVAEEFGTPPAIAIVDVTTGVVTRIPMASGARPHHVHASVGGNLVAFGLYGTDMVAVVDTRDDTLLGPWDTNRDSTNGRVHAGVFSKDGQTLYLASDATGEVIALDPSTGHVFWRMSVPGAHELAVTHDGKRAYVSRRTQNEVSVIDLESQTITADLPLSVPDTLQLSSNEGLLTVGLRTPAPAPAQVAVVDTSTMEVDTVTIGGVGTTAGHQWTSPNGHYTFAAFEGPGAGVAVIDHEAGNAVIATLPYTGRPHGVDFVRP